MVRFVSSNFGFLLMFLGAVWWGTQAAATWIGVVVVVIGIVFFLGGLFPDIVRAVKESRA